MFGSFARTSSYCLTREIEDVLRLETWPEQILGLQPEVRAVLRLLQFRDRFRVLAGPDELFAQFIAESQIGRVALDPFAGGVDEHFRLLLPESGQVRLDLRDRRLGFVVRLAAVERRRRDP